MKRSESFMNDYNGFMTKLIANNHAEKVPSSELKLDDGTVWYIPHHGVYNPHKPKIRVVFDCSAEYNGSVLNRNLLQGPDMTNNLTGVLLRFRREPIAITCDIESMFYQVRVDPSSRNFLRFLWFENGDLDTQPVDYRMTVHPFGAKSSPGCANFALKTTADTYRAEHGDEVADFIKHEFYVNDGLQSMKTPEEAIAMIHTSREVCRKGGFNLRQFLSNNKEVVQAIPPDCRAKGIQNIDLHHDDLPIERALGIVWHVESDTFQFHVQLKDQPLTRRGILSTISSVFDPLGLVSPFVLLGKLILQELCQNSADWDDPVPEEYHERWARWRTDLTTLAKLEIPRCYKSKDQSTEQSVELHHFSDASTEGYGQCSYIRLTDQDGRINSSLVMAKSRVAPSKMVTIPRLELSAAVVSVKISNFLSKELGYNNVENYYYTDSKVVLGYIANESRRFHVFVANRVQQIRDVTAPEQWRYVPTKSNPADFASRGLNAQDILANDLWWKGPDFLKSCEIPATPLKGEVALAEDDPEVKRSPHVVLKTSVVVGHADLLARLERFSSWFKESCCIVSAIHNNTEGSRRWKTGGERESASRC